MVSTHPLTRKHQQNLSYALEWLDRSRKDFNGFRLLVRFDKSTKGAVTCRDPALAVYLLQQAVEKAVKSAAAATGKFSYEKLRSHSHNSLLALLDFYEEIVNMIAGRAETRLAFEFLGLDIEQEKHRIKNAKTEANKKPRDRDDGDMTLLERSRAASANEIDAMLDLVLTIRNVTLKEGLKRVFGPHGSIALDGQEIDASSVNHLLKSVLEQARNKLTLPSLSADQTKNLEEMARMLVEDEWDRGEIPKRIRVRRDTEGWLEGWSLVALLLLSQITWPHESTSRYPGPRRRRGNRPAGCDDYSSNLGIVDRLGRLGYVTALAMDGLKPELRKIAAFSSFASRKA